MNKLKKYLKTEADVEFFACVHGASMTFMYGFLQWLGGVDDVPFAIIFQQLLLGYVIAWAQKGLFFKEKAYTKREYLLREVLWCVIPVFLIILTGNGFHWFSEVSVGIAVAFYVCMICFFVMIWLFLKYFYLEDTREMNDLLKKRKKEDVK
ncbi:hypothetical protein [Roseburia sp. 499]|uniref:hypothetical protein n=1 Tax=Roseburia sp. 499 TaxID=1261634 RepID=UPI0009518B52|nr:hypothetical protein [Roseburia sp. 499]WVK68918.1 hypothetical protein BIV20_11065 [Roseburia sp. 499]